MPELLERLSSLASSFRLADALDIAVVAALVYAGWIWVRRSQSRFVLIGLGLFAALYFCAHLLDMYLTLFLFQPAVTVALVALVVIFQEDIRRGFERVATSRFIASSRSAPVAGVLDEIAEAVATLAHKKIGALLVLKGKEPLERHMSGGVVLNGRVSEALLASLFDPHTPGHDGAIVMDNGVIRKFAVHLPLSTNLIGGGQSGTRHAAALGLAERSDAIVVVVSEERGTISIAHRGELRRLASAADLKRDLLAFFSEVAPAERRAWYERVFLQNLTAKVMAIVTSLVAWLVMSGYQIEAVARTFNVPILISNVSDAWLLEQPSPLEVRITVEGPHRAFERFDPSLLSATIEASDIQPGQNRVPINPSAINLPNDLTVHRIEPRRVLVVAHHAEQLTLPVETAFIGELGQGLELTSVSTQPRSVRLLARSLDKRQLQSVRTEPIDLSRVRETETLTKPLSLPPDARLLEAEPEEVQVTLTIGQRRVENPDAADGAR